MSIDEQMASLYQEIHNLELRGAEAFLELSRLVERCEAAATRAELAASAATVATVVAEAAATVAIETEQKIEDQATAIEEQIEELNEETTTEIPASEPEQPEIESERAIEPGMGGVESAQPVIIHIAEYRERRSQKPPYQWRRGGPPDQPA